MRFTNCLFCYEKNTKRPSTTVDFENENKNDLILINYLPSLLDISQNTSLEFNQVFFGFNQLDFICNNCQKLIEESGKIQEEIKKLQKEFEELKRKFKKSIEKNAKIEFKIEIDDNDKNYWRKVAAEKGRNIILNELGYITKDKINENEPNLENDDDDDDMTVYNEDGDYQIQENEEDLKEGVIENNLLNEEEDNDLTDSDTGNFQRSSKRSNPQKKKTKNKKPKKEKQQKMKIKSDKPKRFKSKPKLPVQPNHFFNFPKDVDFSFCAPCNKQFVRKALYFSHNYSFHGGPKYFKCNMCDEIYGTTATLKLHKTRVHDESRGIYPCNLCEKVFRSQQQLGFHTSNSHSKTPRQRNQCKFCNKTFIDPKNHKKHEDGHSNPLLCSLCGAEYFLKASLAMHIRNYHSKKPKIYYCNVCTFKTPDKEEIKKHRETHAKEKNFVCENCGVVYTTKLLLERHKKRNHPSEDEKQSMSKEIWDKLLL